MSGGAARSAHLPRLDPDHAVEWEILVTAANHSTMATPVVDRFLPIVKGIAGFRGSVLSLSNGGFTSVNIFDPKESALEPTEGGSA